jgi:hypothetical protein
LVSAQLARQYSLTPSAVSSLVSRGHHDLVSKDIATELFD